MRKRLVTLAVAGAVGLTGLAAAAGTALAATPTPNGASGTTASPLDRIKQALSGLVGDKTLTQAQADKVAQTLAQAGVGAGGPGGPGGHGGHGGPDLAAAAKALGTTEADLRTALQSGKSLAAVAKDKGVSVDTLVTALVDAAKARIAQEVEDGRLTQAQADQRIADLKTRITERVNSTGPAGGFGRGGHRGPGGPGGEGEPAAPNSRTPSPTTTS